MSFNTVIQYVINNPNIVIIPILSALLSIPITLFLRRSDLKVNSYKEQLKRFYVPYYQFIVLPDYPEEYPRVNKVWLHLLIDNIDIVNPTIRKDIAEFYFEHAVIMHYDMPLTNKEQAWIRSINQVILKDYARICRYLKLPQPPIDVTEN